MKVANDTIVRIHYTLRSDGGEILDQSESTPLAYLHGRGQIVPGLEAALEGKSAGEELKVKVKPEDGYGEHDAEAVFEIPRAKLPKGVEPKVGMELASRTPDGDMIRFRLTKVGDQTVTADANHPLAGQNLNFEIKVVDVRGATEEELSHGHAHGEGGAHGHEDEHEHEHDGHGHQHGEGCCGHDH